MGNIKFQSSNLKLANIVLLMVIFLTGCSKKSEPFENSDRTSKSPSTMRIISMAPNLTEILFALGLDEEIVGVTKFSTYPSQAQDITNVGTFWQPDIEAMLALSPTLMINLWFDLQAALTGRMERVGCEVLTLQIESIAELYSAIEQIGAKVNRTEQANLILEKLRQKQNELTQKYAGRSDRPKVLWVVQRYPLLVAGRETFINELIEMAGGVNAIGPTHIQYPPVSMEEVIGCMPDIIIEPVMDPDLFDEQQSNAVEFYRRYEIVPAMQNGRIHIVDGDLVSRLGPRLDQAAKLIETCLWKEKSNP